MGIRSVHSKHPGCQHGGLRSPARVGLMRATHQGDSRAMTSLTSTVGSAASNGVGPDQSCCRTTDLPSWCYARPSAHQGLGYSGRSCNQAARPDVQGDEATLRWQVPRGRKAASWAERHSRAAYRAGGSVHLFSIPRETLHGGPCDDPGQGLYGVAARRLGAALHLPAGVRRRGAGLRLPPCACRADPGRAETPVALSRTAARPALPCLARHPVQHLAICGIALGTGPVRVLAGSTRRGIADLMNPTSAPPWLALKTLWFSLPAYQGPFVIRATRLGRPGPVALGEGPAMVPLVIPAGPTLNSFFGYRTVPGGLWVKSPGCYAWQVDGLGFSEIIVVRAVLR